MHVIITKNFIQLDNKLGKEKSQNIYVYIIICSVMRNFLLKYLNILHTAYSFKLLINIFTKYKLKKNKILANKVFYH